MVEYRKDVMVYEYDPEKRFFHVVISLKNKPGALAEAARLMAGAGLNVLSSFTSAGSKGERGYWSLFAESGGKSSEEVSELLRSSGFVEEVAVKEDKEGFVVEGAHFPLAWNTGERALLLMTGTVARMGRKMRETFGTGAEVIFFGEGRALGESAAKRLAKVLPAGFAERNIEEVLRIYSAIGWFRVLGVSRSEEEVRVRAGESFECSEAKTGRPNSVFIRGNIASFVGTLLGKEMNCEEVRCVAAGDDYCEFVLRPAKK